MGLSPEYYNSCTDDVLNLYAEVEDRIISDIVRRIIKTGDITETAKWQIRQAQQMGLLYDDIVKDITKYTNKTDREIKKMFENAGVETVNNDNRLHIQAGKSPLDIRQSESMLQILNGVYKNSLTDLKNLTGTTAITSQTAYIGACNSAFMMVSSGAFSYQQALRTVVQEVSQKGATVSYPSGHVDRLDVAVRRSLLTGIGLASRQISEENSRLCDCDLMEISAHSGARPSHAGWQGQIVSLSGRRGYLSKSDIGYGTGAGFGGWNCRHDWYPFYEGISKRNYTQSDLDKLNAKDIEYNGKMYSEYEISQMLRQKERDIRALKREQIAYKTAISETDDKELKSVFQSALTYTNSAIRDKSTQIQDFCNQTGYKRDRFREQVGGKTSVGHNSSRNSSVKNINMTQKNIFSNFKNGLENILKSGKMKEGYYYKAKNIKQAEEFARNILGIPNVSYKGCDIQTANEWNKGLFDTFQRFPILKQNFGFVGECHERNKIFEPLVRKYYTNYYTKRYPDKSLEQLQPFIEKRVKLQMDKVIVEQGTYAESFSPLKEEYQSVIGITVNSNWGKNSKIFEEHLKKDVQLKWHPIGCDTIRSVLDHEIGHQLDELLGLSQNETIQYLFDSRMEEKLTEDISKYSWKNDNPNMYEEMIAEAWAEYCNNPTPRYIAKTIGNLIEELYKKEFCINKED